MNPTESGPGQNPAGSRPQEVESPLSPDKDTVFYMALPQPEFEDLEDD